MLIVAGGIKSFSIDMDLYSEPPCSQTVFGMNIANLGEFRWFTLPEMKGQGSMHATLISVDQRYVYQIAGSNPHCKNVCRLDLDNLATGWVDYTAIDTFTKVPRNFLDRKSRS